MPLYSYRARDENGREFTGALNGANETEVAAELKKNNYFIIALSEKVQEEGGKTPELTFPAFFKQRISKSDVIVFTRQLSVMSSSGIPITAILKGLSVQLKNKRLRDIILNIRDKIEEGKNLSDALRLHPDIFSPFYVSMVKMGEASGNLDEVLKRIVTIEEQEMDTVSKIKTATTYPAVLLVVAVCVILFLLVGILPKFIGIFQTYETKLPVSTTFLLQLSLFVQKYWIGTLIALGAGAVWFRFYAKSEKGKAGVDKFLLRLPIFGQLILKVNIARFARSVSGLITSGITLLEAFSIVEDTTSNTIIKRAFERVRIAITEGKNLAETMRDTGIFPQVVVQMVAAGESTGRLDQMLWDLSRFYDMEVDVSVKTMTTLLEPLLLLFMGGMVAFIALSVLLPIFNLIKIFRH